MMGRFEELVADAKEGNAEALDLLEQEFGGSNLRKTNEDLAKEVENLRAWREKNLDSVRSRTAEELISQLDEGLRTGLTPNDFSDVDPEELTLDRVRERAQQRQTERQSVLETAAKEAGFETVEEYNKALEAVKQHNQQRQRDLEAVGRSASSGGSSGEGGKDDFTEAKEDFDAATKLGATRDEALGEFLHTRMAQQAPVELE